MKRQFLCMAAALIILLLLQGCLPEYTEPEETPEETTAADITESAAPAPAKALNDRFTLRYEPRSTLNPITGQNPGNIIISSLMYESLFVLDESFNAEPVLCRSIETEDFIRYTIEIKPGIAMSDGSTLTAEDAAYSINRARESGRFASKLRVIESVTAEDMTVTIVLNLANSRLDCLLDMPIIKSGTIDRNVPPGSGPYYLSDTEEMMLSRLSGYRDFWALPVDEIYLRDCTSNELIGLFADGSISLVWDDPGDTVEHGLNRSFETRAYNTTTLQFIGFSARKTALADSEVRRAIGCAIDRDYITDTIMPGSHLSSPLAISPAYSLYDTAWEHTDSDPLLEISAILTRIGLADTNSDSYLEYPVWAGEYQTFTLDFIVNSENQYKVQAAVRIAETLRRIGFDVVVRELPWDDFLYTLAIGDFDMYYGETSLSADFDLSPLLLPEGWLNYGNTGSEDYRDFIHSFLSAGTIDEQRDAAGALCDEITNSAPFIPILYKRHAVYMGRGAADGAAPSQSNVFRNFTDWTINLG